MEGLTLSLSPNWLASLLAHLHAVGPSSASLHQSSYRFSCHAPVSLCMEWEEDHACVPALLPRAPSSTGQEAVPAKPGLVRFLHPLPGPSTKQVL